MLILLNSAHGRSSGQAAHNFCVAAVEIALDPVRCMGIAQGGK